jgi:dihydrofolate reductase
MAPDVVAYLAVSLDGFVAEADGGVHFLDDFGSDEFGYDDFIEGVGAAVMGSTTYEQVVGFGWPYGDMPTLVLTSRKIDKPEGANITFSSERTGDAITVFCAPITKRVWVIGGGKVVTAALQAGAVDTLELYVMPVLDRVDRLLLHEPAGAITEPFQLPFFLSCFESPVLDDFKEKSQSGAIAVA